MSAAHAHPQPDDNAARPVRRPIVGVMGSGSDEHSHLTEPLGWWLAGHGYHLLTGGGGGVMAAVSRAFCSVPDRSGLAIGIVPGQVDPTNGRHTPPAGYPNACVELTVTTHLPLSGERGAKPMSRNHINVLSSQVIVALPGGPGTSSEVKLAVRYARPVIAWLGPDGQIPDLPPDVPLADDLLAVQRFVLQHAGGTGLG